MFWIAIAIPMVVGIMVLTAMRGSRIRAATEFESDRRQRQLDALQGDIDRAEKLEREVEVAKKVVLSGDLDLSERLRQSGRSRTPTK